MKNLYIYLLLSLSILASIAGIALFVILFVPDFNIYWVILSPIIFALYQAPAAYLFYLYRKTKQRIKTEESESLSLKSEASKTEAGPNIF